MINTTQLLSQGRFYVENIFSGFLSQLIMAVIILLIGFIVGKLLGRVVQKVLHELELDAILKKMGLKLTLESTLGMVTSLLVYFISIVMALNQLGLTSTVLYIIVGAAILLILISTILAVKDFIPNLISGFFIHKKGYFQKGNRIKVNGVEGQIVKVSLIETEILTGKKDTIYIPNSLLVKTAVLVKKKKP